MSLIGLHIEMREDSEAYAKMGETITITIAFIHPICAHSRAKLIFQNLYQEKGGGR